MESGNTSHWISCRECDALHQCIDLKHGQLASCQRCGSELYRHVENSSGRVLAFSLTALILFILSHLFPFLTLQMGARRVESQLVSGALELGNQGYWELAVLVFLTSVLFPAMVIAGLLYVALADKLGSRLPAHYRVLRYVKKVLPWSLVGVFMLGVLVAIFKLMDLASVVAGPSLYCFVALLVVMVAATASLDERQVWGIPTDWLTAHGHEVQQGMDSCHCCQLLIPREVDLPACPRCGETLHSRKPNSIHRTWALLISAAILYVPANLYPIMTVTYLGRGEPDTIFSGVVKLIETGLWGLALLVFFASIVVPMMKLLVLAFLLVSVQRRSSWRPRDRTVLFRINEIIGAWSMLDIFLIGILVSLVQMDILASITPGPGASFFAAVVILTLFAAHSFDARLIWDNLNNNKQEHSADGQPAQ